MSGGAASWVPMTHVHEGSKRGPSQGDAAEEDPVEAVDDDDLRPDPVRGRLRGEVLPARPRGLQVFGHRGRADPPAAHREGDRLDPFHLRVEIGGRPVEVVGGRLRALLTRLALEAGHFIGPSALVDFLWGEATPNDPANALQSLVSRLRRALQLRLLPPSPLPLREPSLRPRFLLTAVGLHSRRIAQGILKSGHQTRTDPTRCNSPL